MSKFNKLYFNLFTTITSASNVNRSWQYIQSVFTFPLPFEYKELTGSNVAYIDIPPFEQYLHRSNLYNMRNTNIYVGLVHITQYQIYVNILLAPSFERFTALTNMNTHYEMKRFNVYRTFQLK